MSILGLQMHPENVQNKDIIIYKFFWNPNFAPTIIYIGDWVIPKKQKWKRYIMGLQDHRH